MPRVCKCLAGFSDVALHGYYMYGGYHVSIHVAFFSMEDLGVGLEIIVLSVRL